MFRERIMDDERKKLKKEREKEHYVDNDKFLEEMKIYLKQVKHAKKQGEPTPVLTEYLGDCIIKINNKLANRPNFISYTYRDEMILDGIENCLKSISNFSPKKSKNPFAYFSQIAFFAFVRRIQQEKKYLYKKYKCAEDLLLNHSFEDENGSITPNKYINAHSDAMMQEFMRNFEESKNKKNDKQNRKKNHKIKKTLKMYIE